MDDLQPLPIDADRAAKEAFLVSSGGGYPAWEVVTMTDQFIDWHVAAVTMARSKAAASARLNELMAKFQALMQRVGEGTEDPRVVAAVLGRIEAALDHARLVGGV